MQGKRRQIRLAAAIGAAALGAFCFSAPALSATAGIPELGGEPVATATGSKQKPKLKCEGALQSKKSERYGFEIFTWTVCGQKGGVPFG